MMETKSWKFGIRPSPFAFNNEIYGICEGENGQKSVIRSIVLEDIAEGEYVGEPFLLDERHDGFANKTGFIQAIMDAGWEAGYRPAGYEDYLNELKAVREHKDDLKKIVWNKLRINNDT